MHSKLEPGSLEVKANDAVVADVVAVGPEVIVVSGGVVSAGGALATVNARVAGVASVLPAASVARTETLCAPSVSVGVVHGLVHVAHAPASTRHSKDEPDSLDVNANVGVLSLVEPVGPELIVVSGGVVSAGGALATVNARVAGVASVLPAASVARTETLCAPSVSVGVVHGLVQSLPRRVHAALEDRVRLRGGERERRRVVVGGTGRPELIVVSGGVVSAGGALATVNARVAGVASVLPAASVARTETLCAPSVSVGVVHGLVQSLHAPASTRHSKTAFGSEAVNANVGVLSLVEPVGPN